MQVHGKTISLSQQSDEVLWCLPRQLADLHLGYFHHLFLENVFLDEATSAVDNETEAALQRSIAKISDNRTTLIIAHRLSTIRNAHQIIVLDNGVIAERGTHEELLELDGQYRKLWAVQTGE